MKISARNQLKAEITSIKTGAVNSQIGAKLKGGESLNAIITVESEKNLDLKVGKEVLFIFKAPSVMIAKVDESGIKLSARNQLNGKVKSVNMGAVNAEIIVSLNAEQEISAIITRESAQNLALNCGDEVIAIIKSSSIIIGA